jgi:hypothetical protein
VILGEVTGVDKEKKCVFVTNADRENVPLNYDCLVIATGVSHSYFGHNEFEQYAPGLKTVADAVAIRNELLHAFEQAEARKILANTGIFLHLFWWELVPPASRWPVLLPCWFGARSNRNSAASTPALRELCSSTWLLGSCPRSRKTSRRLRGCDSRNWALKCVLDTASIRLMLTALWLRANAS